jgi:protocatechuate 4,5-dioxygenase beta chain
MAELLSEQSADLCGRAADSYRNEDEGWGIPSLGTFTGDAALSWHIIEQLIADEIDPATCQEMLVDHAFTLPLKLLWPDQPLPVRVVPSPRTMCSIPPSPALLARPVDRPPSQLSSGSARGGRHRWLSHQLDGQRAGFINKEFDMSASIARHDRPLTATACTTGRSLAPRVSK